MILVVNLVIGSQCWLCERNIFIVLITLRFTQTLSCHLIWLVGRCIELGLSAVRSVCGQMEDVRDWESSIPDIRRLRPDTRRLSGHNGPSDTRRYPVTRIRLTCHTQWQWSSETRSYIIDRDHINEIKIWRTQASFPRRVMFPQLSGWWPGLAVMVTTVMLSGGRGETIPGASWGSCVYIEQDPEISAINGHKASPKDNASPKGLVGQQITSFS